MPRRDESETSGSCARVQQEDAAAWLSRPPLHRAVLFACQLMLNVGSARPHPPLQSIYRYYCNQYTVTILNVGSARPRPPRPSRKHGLS